MTEAAFAVRAEGLKARLYRTALLYLGSEARAQARASRSRAVRRSLAR